LNPRGDMSAEASATTLAVAAAAASSSAKNSRCSSRGISSQHLCRQGTSKWVSKEDTVNLQALRVFASYLPAGLVLRYAASADPRPPVQPEREDFEAVVCFLDVSGFTALSEKLQKDHGQAGAELLNKYTNAYFERLIERLSAHGGDVIKFAGDALQCIWRNAPRWPGQQEQSLPSLVLRASACCIDIVALGPPFHIYICISSYTQVCAGLHTLSAAWGPAPALMPPAAQTMPCRHRRAVAKLMPPTRCPAAHPRRCPAAIVEPLPS